MGRHSAPDDGEAGSVDVESTLLVDDPPTGGFGRHAVAEARAVDGATVAEPAVEPESGSAAEPGVAPGFITEDGPATEVIAPVGERKGIRADLDLLRRRPVVLLQAVLAVALAFAGYAVVMALLGRTGSFVLWLWVPILVAGVALGAVLDVAHRRASRIAAATPEPEARPRAD